MLCVNPSARRTLLPRRKMVSRKQVAPSKTSPGRNGTRLSAPASASSASKNKTAVLEGKIKKKRRWRPGTVCLREIRR